MTATASDILRAMAARIDKNDPADFGGCFVIIPPDGAAPVETLILDNKHDLSQFWSLLKTQAQMAVNEEDQRQRMNAAYGGR